MFDDTNAQHIYAELDLEPCEKVSLREIVEACKELPESVRNATFAHVRDRRITMRIVQRLCCAESTDGSNESHVRLKRRRSALSGHLGQILTCIYIRLPGVHYTVEVDQDSQNVVYWEWQAIN